MSNRFQPGIHFKTVEDFLEYLPEKELAIVETLRSIILEEIPDVSEKLSYNVPFYSRKKRICFIWPPSIPWGNNPTDLVILGFAKGHLINHPLIEMGSRKEVGEIGFANPSEIDEEVIRTLLMEALLVDGEN